MASCNKASRSYKTLRLEVSDVDGYVETETTRLRDLLAEAGMNPKEMIYRGISGDLERVRTLKQQGTDLPKYPSIMAFTYDEVFSESEPPEEQLTLWECVDPWNQPAVIALYRASHFKPQERATIQDPFFFSNPEKKLEALVAIIDVVA